MCTCGLLWAAVCGTGFEATGFKLTGGGGAYHQMASSAGAQTCWKILR